MTAPDHTPYLLPTDLRTPEDVLAWLRATEPLYLDLSFHLGRRLDRERRQACRRGAVEAWRSAVERRKGEREWAKSKPDETFSQQCIDEHAAGFRAERVVMVQESLAFRAAARAK